MFRIFCSISMIIACLSLQGCNKAKSDKWLVANVRVYDALTGSPLQVNVHVEYQGSHGGAAMQTKHITTVETDAEGMARIEYKVGEEHPGWTYRMFVNRPGDAPFIGGYSHYNDGVFGFYETLNINEENVFEFGFQPYRAVKVSAVNTNCMSPTDTMWIESPDINYTYLGVYEHEVYGCADTLLPNEHWSDSFILCESSLVDFHITTKKLGVVNSYTETYSVPLSNQPTDIVIEY